MGGQRCSASESPRQATAPPHESNVSRIQLHRGDDGSHKASRPRGRPGGRTEVASGCEVNVAGAGQPERASGERSGEALVSAVVSVVVRVWSCGRGVPFTSFPEDRHARPAPPFTDHPRQAPAPDGTQPVGTGTPRLRPRSTSTHPATAYGRPEARPPQPMRGPPARQPFLPVRIEPARTVTTGGPTRSRRPLTASSTAPASGPSGPRRMTGCTGSVPCRRRSNAPARASTLGVGGSSRP